MRTLAVLAILAAAGCAGGPKTEDVEKIRSDQEKLRMEMTNKNDLQVQLYQEMLSKMGQVLERLGKTESLVADLQPRMDRLEDQMKSAAAAAARPPAAPPSPAATEPAGEGPGKVTMKTVEQVLLETEAAIAAVRAGKIRPEEAAHQLKPCAKHAAPRILDEMRRNVAQIEYTIQLEAVLSRLPAEELKGPLQKALSDTGIRLSAARVVGSAGDRELSKILEEAAAGDDEDLRLMAGESLVRCRNAAGIPALTRCLRSEQRDTRTIAINALRALNRNQDFGYRAQQSPGENAAAIRQWDEWAEKFGKVIFD
jgi:hypothetical protein